MSTIVEDLQALLDPLAAGGSWFGANTAEPPTYPYIVFQRVYSTASVSLQGPSDLQNTRVQIDLYSRSAAELIALDNALELAFVAWSVTNVPLGSQGFYEDETRVHRVSKDYSVWSTN